jgi:hypothetical protein
MKYYKNRRYENKHILRRWYKNHEAVEYPDVNRPRYRWQCEGVQRPCPFVSCRHNLYLDVVGDYSILFNNAELEPWEVENSCALDVAEKGAITHQEIGDMLNMSPQAIDHIYQTAQDKILRLQSVVGKFSDREYLSDADRCMSVSMPMSGHVAVGQCFADTEDDDECAEETHY